MPRSTIRTKHLIVAGLEAELLKRVRKHTNGVSRVDLARALRLAPSTVGIYVDRLVKEGFLIEGEPMAVTRRHGRRPTLLTPNPAAGRFVGVDFEAHSIMTMVVDFSLQTLSRSVRTINKGDSLEQILDKIEEGVRAATKNDGSSLMGICVGVPGVIDTTTGLVSNYEFIAGWNNVPIASMLAERFAVPLHVENNIRAMAMAELWLGQGRGLRDFLCLGIRTGTSVAIVVDGELFRGSHGAAGEIGQWPVSGPARGRAFSIGQTLESTASLDMILKSAGAATGKEMDIAALRAALEVGDLTVLRVIEEAAALYATAIRQLYHVFDPERIILVGPLAELGAAFLTPLTAAVDLRVTSSAPFIVNSSFGQFGGALGAAALALHRWRPTRARAGRSGKGQRQQRDPRQADRTGGAMSGRAVAGVGS